MSLLSEFEVLQAAFDVAGRKTALEDINSQVMVESLENICRRYPVSKKLKDRCFQLIVLMSSDTAHYWNWKEKLRKLDYFMRILNRSADSPSRSSSSSPSSSRATQKPSPSKSSRSLSPNMNNKTRFVSIPASKVSTTSPGTLHEGAELSMILNNRDPIDLYRQSSYIVHNEDRQTTPITPMKSILKQPEGQPLSYSSLRLFSTPESTSKRNISFLNDSQSSESIKHIQDKVDSIEKDSQKTRNLIAHLAYRIDKKNISENSFVFKNSSRMNDMSSSSTNANEHQFISTNNMNDHSHNDLEERFASQTLTTTPSLLHPNDLFSPVTSKFDQSQIPRDQEDELKYDITTPGLSPPMHNRHKSNQEAFATKLLQEMISPANNSFAAIANAQQTIQKTQQVREFSQSLRQSAVMQKYLQSTTSPSPSVRRLENNESLVAATLTPNTKAVVTRSSISDTLPGRSNVSDTIDHYTNRMENPPPGTRQSVAFTPTMTRQSTMTSSTSVLRARLVDPNYSSIDMLTIDPAYLPYDEANMQYYTAHAASSMKLFLLFQKWFIKRMQTHPILSAPPTRLFQSPSPEQEIPHFISTMFYTHFHLITEDFALPALSNLFGLEQWLREKLYAFVCYQTKLQLFTYWSQECFTKYALSTQYYRQKVCSYHYELWREYHVKLQLKYKNTIVIYFIDQIAAGKTLLARERTTSSSSILSSTESIKRMGKSGSHKMMKRRKQLFGEIDRDDSRSDDIVMDNNHNNSNNSRMRKAQFVSWKDWYQQVQLYHHLLFYRYHTQVTSSRLYPPMTQSQEEGITSMKQQQQQQPLFLPFYHARILTSTTNKLYDKQPYNSSLHKHDFPFHTYQQYGYPVYTHVQYETCLDQVFLYTQFRRFIHRTLYLRKARYLNETYRVQKPLVRLFQTMKHSYRQRKTFHDMTLEPLLVDFTHNRESLATSKAFHRLLSNVRLQKERRLLYGQYKSSLLANPSCIVAIYMFSAPYYVRCFHVWKQNMMQLGGIVRTKQASLNSYHNRYRCRKVLSSWKAYTNQKQEQHQWYSSFQEWKYCWLLRLYQQSLFQQRIIVSGEEAMGSPVMTSRKGQQGNSTKKNEVLSIDQFDKQLINYKQLMRKMKCCYYSSGPVAVAALTTTKKKLQKQYFAIVQYDHQDKVSHQKAKPELCKFSSLAIPSISSTGLIENLTVWMDCLQSYSRHPHQLGDDEEDAHKKPTNDAMLWSYHEYRNKLEESYSQLWHYYHHPMSQSLSIMSSVGGGPYNNSPLKSMYNASSSTPITIETSQYLQLLQQQQQEQQQTTTSSSQDVTTSNRHPVYYHRHIPSLLRIFLYKWQRSIQIQQYYRHHRQTIHSKRLNKYLIAWKQAFQLMHIVRQRSYVHVLSRWQKFIYQKQYHTQHQQQFVLHYRLRKTLYRWKSNLQTQYSAEYENSVDQEVYNHISGLFANHYTYERLWYFIRQKCLQFSNAMKNITALSVVNTERGQGTKPNARKSKRLSDDQYADNKPISLTSRYSAFMMLLNPSNHAVTFLFTRQWLQTLPMEVITYLHSLNQFILWKSTFSGSHLSASGFASPSATMMNAVSSGDHNTTISSKHLTYYLVTLKGIHTQYLAAFGKWQQFLQQRHKHAQKHKQFQCFLLLRSLNKLRFHRCRRKSIRTVHRKILTSKLVIWKMMFLYHRTCRRVKQKYLKTWNDQYRRQVYTKVWNRWYGNRIQALWQRWCTVVKVCRAQEQQLLQRLPVQKLQHHWQAWCTVYRMSRYHSVRLRKVSWQQFQYAISLTQILYSDDRLSRLYYHKQQLMQWKKLVFHTRQQHVLEAYASLWYHYRLLLQGMTAWYKFFAPKWSRKFNLNKRIALWKSRIFEELEDWKRQQYPYSMIALTATGAENIVGGGGSSGIGGGIAGIPPYVLQWKEWKLYQYLQQHELQQLKHQFFRSYKSKKSSEYTTSRFAGSNNNRIINESVVISPQSSGNRYALFRNFKHSLSTSHVKSHSTPTGLSKDGNVLNNHANNNNKRLLEKENYHDNENDLVGDVHATSSHRQARYVAQHQSLLQLQQKLSSMKNVKGMKLIQQKSTSMKSTASNIMNTNNKAKLTMSSLEELKSPLYPPQHLSQSSLRMKKTDGVIYHQSNAANNSSKRYQRNEDYDEEDEDEDDENSNLLTVLSRADNRFDRKELKPVRSSIQKKQSDHYNDDEEAYKYSITSKQTLKSPHQSEKQSERQHEESIFTFDEELIDQQSETRRNMQSNGYSRKKNTKETTSSVVFSPTLTSPSLSSSKHHKLTAVASQVPISTMRESSKSALENFTVATVPPASSSSSSIPPSIKSSLYQDHMRRQAKLQASSPSLRKPVATSVIVPESTTPLSNKQNQANNNASDGALSLSFSRIRLEDLDLDTFAGSSLSQPLSHTQLQPPGTFETTITTLPSPYPHHYAPQSIPNHSFISPTSHASHRSRNKPYNALSIDPHASTSHDYATSMLPSQSSFKHPLSDLSVRFSTASMFSRPTSCTPQDSDSVEHILFKRAWWKWQQYRLHHHYYRTVAKQHAYYNLAHHVLDQLTVFAHKHRVLKVLYRRCSFRHVLIRWDAYLQRQYRLEAIVPVAIEHYDHHILRKGLKVWRHRSKQLSFLHSESHQKAAHYRRFRKLSIAMVYWKAILYDHWCSQEYKAKKQQQKDILDKQRKNSRSLSRQKRQEAEEEEEDKATQRLRKNSVFSKAKNLLHFLPKKRQVDEDEDGDGVREEKRDLMMKSTTTVPSSKSQKPSSRRITGRNNIM